MLRAATHGIRACRLTAPISVRHNNYVSSALVRGILNRVFNIPKGFRKFYPKNNSGAATEESAASKAGRLGKDGGPNRGSGGKGGGNGKGGGSGKKPEDPQMTGGAWATIIALGLVPVAYALAESSGGGKNMISYQEFHNNLLPSGQVSRITVLNKSVARVEMDGNTPSIGTRRQVGGELSPDSSFDSPKERNDMELQEYQQQQHGMTVGGSLRPIKPLSALPNVIADPLAYYITIGSVDSFEKKLEDSQRAYGMKSHDFIPVVYTDTADYFNLFYKITMVALIAGSIALTVSMFKGQGASGGGMGGLGGMMNVGKSKAKKITKEMVNVTFKDVAGCNEAKKEIMEFVEFLKDHKKFTALGAKIPKGALISGPPGTGKTLLAKATAGEASVPFFSISGSDFVEMFVGVGPSRVRDLFKEARAAAPCIVFIDEIDAVGRKRGGGRSGGYDERENTLNQLLVEMDGFDTTAGIVIFAGTNRVDVLDPALLRPGRFDRKIIVDNPDIQGRKSIFSIYLQKLTLADSNIEQLSSRLAALTPGFAGADIANICNEAAIVAARKNKKAVELVDFESATDRVIGGLETNKLMSPEEKRVVAYHEAGHAVAGWNLEYADPLLKVTIVPRGNGALGFAQYLPKEIFLRNRQQLLDMVCMALAGRASEQINFGRVTTGAADDLRRVTGILYQMVQVFGMNEKVGQVSFPKDNEGGFPSEKPYGNATAELMDNEVRRLVDEAYERTLALIEAKKEQVTAVAELLLAQETITHIDVARLIGKRPYDTDKEYAEFVSTSWDKPLEVDKTCDTVSDASAAESTDSTDGCSSSPTDIPASTSESSNGDRGGNMEDNKSTL